MKTGKKKRIIKGFTLVEIMVVLLIISIIGIIAIPNINKMRDNAKREAYNKKTTMIQLAAENYVLDNKNKIIESCKSGANSRCYSCGTDCYNVQVGISDLINNGGLKPDSNNGCQISSPYGGCLSTSRITVRLSNKKQTKVVAQNIVMSSPKNMNVVDNIKYLARTDDPKPGPLVVIDNGSSDSTCTNTFAYDGTEDNNLRYIGGNPCNYVVFNNELWRIVGAMNNIEDAQGHKETRVKLVRDESLGSYQFDIIVDSSGNKKGYNDWSKSDLMNELNGDYLNYNLDADTKWYYSTPVNTPKDEKGFKYFDHTKALKAEAQNYIDSVKWNLGAITERTSLSTAYTQERGTNVWGASEGQTCDDEACPRATSWIGKVGLLYPTDARYSGSGQYSRRDCIGLSFTGSSSACIAKYNYLNGLRAWGLNPGLSANTMIEIYAYSSQKAVNENEAVYPTIYLKSGVKIASGNGSETDPYILK